MKGVWLAMVAYCSGLAVAGGGGEPPKSRTVPVFIMNFSAGGPDGVFICDDGSTVFSEQVFSATGEVTLRLTRRGQVYADGQTIWRVGAKQKYTLTLGQTPLSCRPATAKDASFKPGPGLNYRCDDAISLAMVPFPEAVAILSFKVGQPPDVAGLLPQVRSASGVKYQNSEWTWFGKGREGFLDYHGQTVAQNCRLQSADAPS